MRNCRRCMVGERWVSGVYFGKATRLPHEPFCPEYAVFGEHKIVLDSGV